jgi:predicted ribosomally synthesized peptide with nif11-like leader
MSQTDFEQFRQAVLEDISLQKQLRNITRRHTFTARAVKLGAERGFQFTEEEVYEALGEWRRLWIERWI